MVESYIITIDNLDLFTYGLKEAADSVEYVTYDSLTRTVEIGGTFTELEKGVISNFVLSYTNYQKVYTTNVKTLPLIVNQTKIRDWFTISSWEENSVLQKLVVNSMLAPGVSDNLYEETFRYEIRIVNVTDNIVIKTVEFYNSEYSDCVINGIHHNTSLGNKELELQIKKYNKGSCVYIKRLCAEYP